MKIAGLSIFYVSVVFIKLDTTLFNVAILPVFEERVFEQKLIHITNQSFFLVREICIVAYSTLLQRPKCMQGANLQRNKISFRIP